MGRFTAFLNEVGLDDLRQVGGKGANLGHLAGLDCAVPAGFCLRADAYDLFLSDNELRGRIEELLGPPDNVDLEAVSTRAEEVRALLESIPIPEPVEEELRQAYRVLTGGGGQRPLVAVRSSVGTRDLSWSSFPGQMDTYHNIAGEDEVVRLVRKCWASAFSYPAVVSRNAKGIAHFDVFVAPIVQVMVPAESAGVIFTANPLNNRTDQMVLNACLGLGEGVVSGEVNADHYVLDSASLEVIEESIGEKRVKFVLDENRGRGTAHVPLGREESRAACLSPEQVREIASAAREIEGFYGRPQDIEWAYCDGELFILQSRAITTIDERKTAGEPVSEFDTTVDPRYPYYTLSNISEVLCGVLTPLTISGIDALDYGFVKTNTDFGLMNDIKPRSEHTFIGIFYGRAHLNLSVVKAVTSKLPGASAQEFERMVPDDATWKDESFKATPRAVVSMMRSMARILGKMVSTPRDAASLRCELSDRIARSRRLDFETLPYSRCLEWMDSSRRYRFEVVTMHITTSQFAVVFHDFLRKLTERWLDDGSGALAARLVTGLQNIESAQPNIEIWDLSRQVLESRELKELFAEKEPSDILGELRSSGSPDAGGFLESLEGFLSRFGYRGVFEAELMLPNWGEDPSYVFAMIRNCLGTDPTFDPRKLAKERELEREQASRDAMERLKRPRRWLLALLLRETRRYIALREFTKATLVMGIAQIKREYHALARRFTAEGLIGEPRDLFFLTGPEVRTMMRGGKPDTPLDELVARRIAEYERDKGVVLPEYSNGRPGPVGTGTEETRGTVLSGIAVSPGKVTGRARVITDPRSRSEIHQGEILVAPVTDAAWTPLFVPAGAIVVDVGGPLSHGSIVAREYGIPGVLNVGIATKIIKDGQLLTVDGDTGTVYLHGTGDEPTAGNGGFD